MLWWTIIILKTIFFILFMVGMGELVYMGYVISTHSWHHSDYKKINKRIKRIAVMVLGSTVVMGGLIVLGEHYFK
ncbi:hypothetical protein [Bacillus cereus]|uniref:hypothetical protein n=1 Tax=Bacillus cereus TaxID=1396 RepID=UPI000BEC175E|nr:hypothetical protein [Bacillus cereus]PDY82755.1 hypothetical protein CON06_10140 [Bacillus cereus]